MHPTRRDLLKNAVVGAGLAALTTPGLSALSPLARSTRRVVILFCYGGFDGLNMAVPVENSAYYDRRPTLAISPATALPMAGTSEYRLHPSLQNLQGLWDRGEVAIVQKVGYPSANLSHFASRDIYSYGIRDFGSVGISKSGWIARYAETYAQQASDVVGIGVGRRKDFVGTSATPLIAKRLRDFRFLEDNRYRRNHELRIDLIRRRLDESQGGPDAEVANLLKQGHEFSDSIQAAVQSYDPVVGATYPTGRPGRELKDIATLIRAGFPTSVFLTGCGGWDTHGQQGAETGRQADGLAEVDGALGAFSQDLSAVGEWEDTTFVIVSEFGRRNYENGSQGTDHGHGNVMFVIGPRVRGGIYGPSLTEQDIADARYLDYEVDFRDVYREIAESHLQVDPTPLFPEAQPTNTTLNLF